MAYRIGILEVCCAHHKVADLCNIADPGSNHVSLFTTHDIHQRFREEAGDWAAGVETIVKSEADSLAAYLARVASSCDNYDVVVLNTLRRHQLLRFRPRCRLVGVFYDMNWWFRDTTGALRYFVDLCRPSNICDPNPLANAVTGRFLRRRLLDRMDAALVEYPPFVPLVRDVYGYRKPVRFLPNSCFVGRRPARSGGPVTFAIGGTINDARRDYDLVLDAMERLRPDVRARTRLMLLGASVGEYGRRIVRRCSQLAGRGFDIYWPSGYMAAEEIESKMSAADVMIAPLKLDYRSGTVRERYTYTKGTAGFSDSLRFGHPSLVPGAYNVAGEFEPVFRKYRDAGHLSSVITELVTNSEGLAQWRGAALACSAAYGLEQLRARFHSVMIEVMEQQTYVTL